MVIALVLLGSAVAFDVLLGREVRRSFDDALRQQALDRATLIDDGAAPASVISAVGDEEFVAVVGSGGGVLASQGLFEPDELQVPEAGQVVSMTLTIIETGEEEGEEAERNKMRVYAAATASGGAVVVGGEGSDGPQEAARRYLLIGVPLLVVFAAGAAWVLVGRSLRPVEALRSDVDAIAGTGAGQRVNVPGSGDELTRLAETMNGLLNRIDAHALRQREFVADASHELKSPVANLRALAETSGRPLDDPSWQDLRSLMVGEASRLQHLVDDLLFLARTDEARTAPSSDLVHLDDILFDEAERAAIDTAVRVDASSVVPADVRGEAVQLTRVVRNLLENAVHHASAVVRVSVSSGGEGRDVVIVHVDDDGPGVPHEARERVFERFTRLDADRARPSGGTGLGLAIVQQVVGDHGGRVSIGDSDLGGARFSVELPAAG